MRQNAGKVSNLCLCATFGVCTVAHMHNSKLNPAALIATAEAAELLGVSVATVNRWAASGALSPAVKTPGPRGANLFHRDEITALRKDRDRRSQKAGA